MDFKSFFKLDHIYGKKLVNILYYASIFISVASFFYSLVSAVTVMVRGGGYIVQGIWQFVSAPFILVFTLIIIRVACELLTVFFSRHNSD